MVAQNDSTGWEVRHDCGISVLRKDVAGWAVVVLVIRIRESVKSELKV